MVYRGHVKTISFVERSPFDESFFQTESDRGNNCFYWKWDDDLSKLQRRVSTKGWKEEFIEPFWSRSNVLLDPFMNRIPVTGSIIFLHWDERKKKKKNNESEGGEEMRLFLFFFRRWIFRKTADSKIWIKLKKKILEEPKYFHKQILFANRYYFYLISAM